MLPWTNLPTKTPAVTISRSKLVTKALKANPVVLKILPVRMAIRQLNLLIRIPASGAVMAKKKPDAKSYMNSCLRILTKEKRENSRKKTPENSLQTICFRFLPVNV